MATTPEIEQALTTPHAQRIVANALREHSKALKTSAAKDTALGYADAGREKAGDESLIAEVILPAFTAQTGLELDVGAELKATLGNRLIARLKPLAAEIVRHHTEETGQGHEAVVTCGNQLAEWLDELIHEVATRSYHDGVSARELLPEQTILRTLRAAGLAKGSK
jgi:hypothetical protein